VCQPRQARVASFTARGGRAVYVCRSAFLDVVRQGTAAFVIIHEMLHSLGLGENAPHPTSLGPGQRRQVSQQGGMKTWWTRDSRQLLFLGNDQRSLWRVDVEPGATLRIGTPKRIGLFPPGITSMRPTD
jgi:hypothetical protein